MCINKASKGLKAKGIGGNMHEAKSCMQLSAGWGHHDHISNEWGPSHVSLCQPCQHEDEDQNSQQHEDEAAGADAKGQRLAQLLCIE